DTVNIDGTTGNDTFDIMGNTVEVNGATTITLTGTELGVIDGLGDTAGDTVNLNGTAGDDDLFVRDSLVSNAGTHPTGASTGTTDFEFSLTNTEAFNVDGGLTGANALTVQLPAGADDNVTVDETAGAEITLDNALNVDSFTNLATLTIDTQDGNDVINITDTSEGATQVVANAGDGMDAVNAGGTDLDNLGGDVTVTGGDPTGTPGDSLTVDDTAETGGDTYTVTGTTIARDGRTVTYGTTENMTLNMGTGANTADINGRAAGVTTSINGGAANDTFNVGATDLTANILGDVDINGMGGDDIVTVIDTGDTVGETFNITGAGVVFDPAGTPITVAFAGDLPAQLDVMSGTADDVFNLDYDTGLPADINLDGGLPTASDSVVISGSTGADDFITAAGTSDVIRNATDTLTLDNIEDITFDITQDGVDAVTVNFPWPTTAQTITVNGGGAGSDALTVNAQTGQDDAATVTANSIQVAGESLVNFNDIDVLTLDLMDDAGGGDTVNVEGTTADDNITVESSAGTATQLVVSQGTGPALTIGLIGAESIDVDVSQDGADVVTVNQPAGNPVDAQAALLVTGGGATGDALIVNTPTGPAAQTVRVDEDSIDVTGQTPVTFVNMDTITVNTGTGTDTVNIDGTTGNDTFDIMGNTVEVNGA
ncbi:MAG: hypothetical protein QGF67_20595, partial [Lentisphaeria bacterium]|nr:hypothetical protein [Lentisphaeria bacterium]